MPFMILCSLRTRLNMTLKEMNDCNVPEWWPQGFPFKFPLVEQSHWINVRLTNQLRNEINVLKVLDFFRMSNCLLTKTTLFLYNYRNFHKFLFLRF